MDSEIFVSRKGGGGSVLESFTMYDRSPKKTAELALSTTYKRNFAKFFSIYKNNITIVMLV